MDSTVPAHSLDIAIFSFNRGTFLEHCAASVARNAPFADWSVYDDNSTDPATLATLDRLGDRVAPPAPAQEHRLGGLYRNMGRALEATRARYLLFLQDDMQIVRPLDAADIESFDRFFAADPNAAFITPLFQKAARRRSRQRYLVPVEGQRGYHFSFGGDRDKRLVDQFYNDVTICHVDRLRAAGWQFHPDENRNAEQAREIFSKMMFLGDPFAFFCLAPPTYRFKATTLGARLAARAGGATVKGFHDMTADEVARLRARPIEQVAFAEDWLTPTDPDAKRPFVFKAVNQRLHWRVLNKLELLLRGK